MKDSFEVHSISDYKIPGGIKAAEYIYLGDRNTDPGLKNKPCAAVRRADGRCIRGRNGSMLVRFANEQTHVVTARLLRKSKNHSHEDAK